MNQNEGFSKSTAALAKTFMYRAFDSEEYARSLSAQSDGDKDLIEKRAKISQVCPNESFEMIAKYKVGCIFPIIILSEFHME